MKLWFKAHTYGYGWSPSSWEGWVCVLFYFLVMIGLSVNLERSGETTDDLVFFFTSVAVATGALMWIAAKKGEPARWRWGGK
jgi:hypothetical protein